MARILHTTHTAKIDSRRETQLAITRSISRLRGRLRLGFTLIEMLIVIAIISILVALIFPVFGTIMENGRETNSMSNMQQISSALALYKLDNRYYPPVLFGYAVPDPANVGSYVAMGAAQGQPAASQYLVGLYPEYIHDWHVFTSPNNPTDNYTAVTTTNVNIFPTAVVGASPATDTRALTAQSENFYEADAFDISPEITGINATSKTVYVPRYQTSWLSYPLTVSPCYPDGASSCAAPDVDYSRQLRWEIPPSDTYVTSTTYHVNNANRALVLQESGSVKKVNIQSGTWNMAEPVASATMHSAYIDNSGAISAATSGSSDRPNAAADFWRYCGTNVCSGG